MEKKTFQKFDFLGSNITFNIEKERKFKTTFGAILSLFLVIVTLTIFSFYFMSFLKREKPYSYDKSLLDYNQKIKGEDMFFMVGIVGPLLSEIEDLDKKFYFSIRHFHFNDTNSTIDSERIYLVPCNQTSSYKAREKELSSILTFPIKNYYCIPDEYSLEDIKGSIHSTRNSSFYKISLWPCKESLRNMTCVPYEELEKEIINYFLQFIFKNNLVEIEDYQNPIKPYYNSLSLSGNLQVMTGDELLFNKLMVETDDSWIIQSSNIDNSFHLKTREKNVFPATGFDYRHVISLSLSEIHDVHFRSYMKIVTIIANGYSILKIFVTLFAFLNNYFSSYDIIDYLFSYLYNFELKNNYNNPYYNTFSNPDNTHCLTNLNIPEKSTCQNLNNNMNDNKNSNNNDSSKKENSNNKLDCSTNNKEQRSSSKEEVLLNKSTDTNNSHTKKTRHLKYFYNIKEKIPKVKNMNKFFLTRICCCRSTRKKKDIFEKMKLEVYDHLEIFNYLTMSIWINNILSNSEKNFRLGLDKAFSSHIPELALQEEGVKKLDFCNLEYQNSLRSRFLSSENKT